MPTTDPKPVSNPAGASPGSREHRSSVQYSSMRDANARLASSVSHGPASPRNTWSRRDQDNGIDTSFASEAQLPEGSLSKSAGPGTSALASALNASGRQSPSQSISAGYFTSEAAMDKRPSVAQHESFDASSSPGRTGWQSPKEDFEVIRRHLAGPHNASPTNSEVGGTFRSTRGRSSVSAGAGKRGEVKPPSMGDDGFSSLRMQGGDITREIYRRTEAEERARWQQRSKSFNILRSQPVDEDLDYENLRQPGGFRRNHIRRVASSPVRNQAGYGSTEEDGQRPQTNLITRNFFEFLSLYGHFAGEEMDDDSEDEDELDESEAALDAAQQELAQDVQRRLPGEQRPLLQRNPTTRRRLKEDNTPKKGAGGTILILLKSFVGTGVLFLPRAFLNGGMLFSCLVLLAVSTVSYYCFLLLTKSRLALKASYADMGGIVHGKWLRLLINSSLVISQIGFASAYIVFTSENLQGFILAVSKGRTYIDIKYVILMQLVIFLPLSLYRNLNNISFVVYIADLFIVLGLIYLYYFDVATLVQHGLSDIELFNRSSWTLFIGTAVFTFEGIGLLIPIQDGMKNPQQLPAVLGLVMVIITTIFVAMGALSYAAFGSKTETVIILNMPQDNKFVNSVQFLYSLAILLSTPLQIFPAITIMEKSIFTKSGKYNKNTKWLKNGFRFAVVMMSALIAWLGANDLDKFVALVGSFACIPLVYIYPTLIHRKAVAESFWSKTLDVFICCVGLVLMTYTTVLTISSWVGKGPGDT